MKVHRANDVQYTSFTQALFNAGGEKEQVEEIEVVENDETFSAVEIERNESEVKICFDEQSFDVEFEYDASPFPSEPEIGIDQPGADIDLKNIVVVTPKGKVPIEKFYTVLRKEDIQLIEDYCQEIAEAEYFGNEPDTEHDYDLHGRP